jgi:transcriptional regulator GlxA family with amidase domain
VKRNVGIFVFDDVEVLDFAGPFEVFSRVRLEPGVASRRSDDSAPFHVFTVAARPEPVTATGSLMIQPAHTFADTPRIDLLIVPGGFGTRPLLEDPSAIEWIRKIAGSAQQTMSVCTGSLLLAKAGLLTGRRATTHWGALELLGTLDPSIRVEHSVRAVHDGIHSSAGVSTGIDMALDVVEQLHGREVADETARYIEYRR